MPEILKHVIGENKDEIRIDTQYYPLGDPFGIMGPSRYQPRDCTQDAPVCLASNSRNADEIPMKADTKGVHSLELEEQDDEIDQYLENEDELNQLLIKAMRTVSDEIEVWEDTLDITKHPEPGSWITQSERDNTIYEVQVSNYCNAGSSDRCFFRLID